MGKASRELKSLYRKALCEFLKANGVSNAWSFKDAVRVEKVNAILGCSVNTLKEAALMAKTGSACINLPPKLVKVQPTRDSQPKPPKHAAKLSTAVKERGPTRDKIAAFYASPEWKRLSYKAKLKYGRKCMCCGAGPDQGAVINTDHVKPIRKHWRLRLDIDNLQVLCADCNIGKGSWDETDFRAEAA
jgi:5-methylcytosine-specific restriction endonuclease McrA